MTSRATPEFWRLYGELPAPIRSAAQKTYQLFSEHPAHPSLRLERLRSDQRAWAVRVTRDYRAVAFVAVTNGCGSGSVITRTLIAASRHSARELHSIIAEHREKFIIAWDEHFGQ